VAYSKHKYVASSSVIDNGAARSYRPSIVASDDHESIIGSAAHDRSACTAGIPLFNSYASVGVRHSSTRATRHDLAVPLHLHRQTWAAPGFLMCGAAWGHRKGHRREEATRHMSNDLGI